VPIRVLAIGSDLPTQKVNNSNRIIVKGTLIKYILLYLILMQVDSFTEICKSSNNNSEFPPIPEIRPNY